MKQLSLDKSKALKKFDIFFNKYVWIIFLLILAVGLYLRFYNIESIFTFGWDQGRDAWIVKEITEGKFTLIGPRTGVGHMHLGPIYYYLLVPFFYLTNFDPMASNYFNILINVVNYVIIFYVTKKLFNNYLGIFVIAIYTCSNYLIVVNQVPWNVTAMPGISALIFYSLYRSVQGHCKWIFVAWTLSGLFFHLHFTAIFLPVINLLSLLVAKDKRKVIKYSILSIPLYLIWFLPNIIYEIQTNSDSGMIKNFFNDYYIGFHLRFMLHRLPDALIQFSAILYLKFFKNIIVVFPLLFALFIFFEKERKIKKFGYLISLWFLVPLFGFTIYGGPLSDYYFLFSVPMVLFVLAYLHQKLFQFRYKRIFLIFILIFWSYYLFENTKQYWIKPVKGGLKEQKEEVKEKIKLGNRLEYVEGDIKSYLYRIYTK